MAPLSLMEDLLPVPCCPGDSTGLDPEEEQPLKETGRPSFSDRVPGSSSSSSSLSSRPKKFKGLLLRGRRRPRREEKVSDTGDLALPLGMSFAAVVSQVGFLYKSLNLCLFVFSFSASVSQSKLHHGKK